MKKVYLILSLLAAWIFFLTLTGCHRDEQCNASVEGIITDSLTGKPLSGVEVSLYSTPKIRFIPPTRREMLDSDTSDANGNYHLNGSLDCTDVQFMNCSGKVNYFGSPHIELKYRINRIDLKLKPW